MTVDTRMWTTLLKTFQLMAMYDTTSTPASDPRARNVDHALIVVEVSRCPLGPDPQTFSEHHHPKDCPSQDSCSSVYRFLPLPLAPTPPFPFCAGLGLGLALELAFGFGMTLKKLHE